MIENNFMNTLCERDNRIHALYATWAKSKGINYNILTVLCSIYKSKGCTQRQICDEWCLPKQTVNTTCKELLNLELLTSEKNTTDKRETTLSLTDKGYEFILPICQELSSIEENIFNAMGNDKVYKLMELYLEYSQLVENSFTENFTENKRRKCE